LVLRPLRCGDAILGLPVLYRDRVCVDVRCLSGHRHRLRKAADLHDEIDLPRPLIEDERSPNPGKARELTGYGNRPGRKAREHERTVGVSDRALPLLRSFRDNRDAWQSGPLLIDDAADDLSRSGRRWRGGAKTRAHTGAVADTDSIVRARPVDQIGIQHVAVESIRAVLVRHEQLRFYEID